MHIGRFIIAALLTCSAPVLAEPVDPIADAIVALELERDPTAAYTSGLAPPTHARFSDKRPEVLSGYYKRADALLARLDRIDVQNLSARDRVTHAVARELLQAQSQFRVCRYELWAVNHMFGWHILLPLVAERQPVATPDDRAAAIARWGSLDTYVDVEIANLKRGLSVGYSAPKPVVERVLRQVEGLVVADPTKSPLYAPAKRAADSAFQAAFAKVLVDDAQPALRSYAAFLKSDYLPKARDSLGLDALPNGRECYAAWLRTATTLDRTPEAVEALGKSAVAANVLEVRAMGQKALGIDDFKSIIARVRDDPANRFSSEAEILPFVEKLVAQGKQASVRAFDGLPEQPMEVRTYPDHMRGTGVTSHYQRGGNLKTPGLFMLQTDNWDQQRRTDMEVLAFHEAIPGHHMQIGHAAALPTHQISKLAFNAAFSEGWARYAEMLSEELGLYSGDMVKIQRRAWPARGMVADPGLHLGGWTREHTYQYLLEAGRFSPSETAELIDRMAAIPGQLTAYDSGGLEFRALRREAEQALGDRFDLKAFHRVVLENGPVPLALLRSNVEAWIAREKR